MSITRIDRNEGCPLYWNPGNGGLIARVEPNWLPPFDRSQLPVDATALPTDHLHVTLLRPESMRGLVDILGPDWGRIRPRLPQPPRPLLGNRLHRAERTPHERKDPPNETRPRITWFLKVENEQAWREALQDIVAEFDTTVRERGGIGFSHPEPDRFFHLSVLNNRGGDPKRSIGNIGREDLD